MADCKKYNGSTWEHSLRKLTTATDTITTLPAIIYADGNNATVGISGNMEQNGTPTPQNPIQPSECGERTANLVEYYIAGCNIDPPGRLITNGDFNMFVAKIVQGQTYSLDTPLVGGFFTSEPSVNSQAYNNTRDTSGVRKFVAPIDGYVAFRKISTETTAMLNEGETALPYEPYGIKIPISSASTTTPVYLGEVETTRQIKKLVLTGKESWNTQKSTYYITVSDYYRMYDIGSHLSVCSHYPDIQVMILPEMHYCLGGLVDGSTHTAWNGNIVFNPSPMISSLTDWKAFLAQQYAAGTPVTVWYVLAEPETGILNEPIRKIGDYADIVSGITIPTIAGADSFDVLTTLKPSEVTVNYKGWHTGAVHERENGAWT